MGRYKREGVSCNALINVFACRIWQSVSKKGRTMAKSVIYLLMAVVLSAASGCATAPKSGKGFTLPEGDPQAGKANFVSFYCNACHRIDGIDQVSSDGEKPELSVALGGEVTRIETYGELVTSIINPSHRLAKDYPVEEVSYDGESKMVNYNDVMTVTELTDLVAFLQSKYKLFEYELTEYPQYWP